MRAAILGHAVAAALVLALAGWALSLLVGWWIAGPLLLLGLAVVAALTVFAFGARPRQSAHVVGTRHVPGAGR